MTVENPTGPLAIPTETEHADVVVCGGGLAGLCAAVAAARQGASVILVTERPVLGGCSSSEIRVPPQGAAHFHAYARETGIISELIIDDRMHNHAESAGTGWTNSVWDMTLYDLAQSTPGLTLMLNTSIDGVDAVRSDRAERLHVSAVHARTLSAELRWRLTGDMFVDATGDGVVAASAGCAWRMGEEARDEFGEPHAPIMASEGVQGTSIQLMTRDMGRPVPYTAPDWAEHYDDERFFSEGGRIPDSTRGGWWWLELGIPWSTITDNETIRHELTRRALGVWHWIKNTSPEYRDRFADFALDWIGQVPGKRESRRVVGRHLMTEHDLLRATPFADEVAFGGWNIDLHTPGGMLAATSEPTAAEGYRVGGATAIATHVSPFGIPLRSLIARDADNLLLAGRDVSATHVALGSVRVQGTTSLMGHAVGVAAAEATRSGGLPDDVSEGFAYGVQQRLLRDGVFLPHVRNQDAEDLARKARATASSSAHNIGIGATADSADDDYFAPLHPRSGEDRDVLERGRSQWIAVESGPDAHGLDTIGLLLGNRTDDVMHLDVSLERVDGIWDYDISAPRMLRSTRLEVPPGGPHWIDWDVHLGPEPGAAHGSSYLRLNAARCPELSWVRSEAVLPGCTAGVAVTPQRLHRLEHGVTLCHRLSPAQRVWEPPQVLSGVARPQAATNQWRSDPLRGVGEDRAQWLELSWPTPQEVAEVSLQLCGHLLRDYDRLPAMKADPDTLRDYSVQIWDGAWTDVATVVGNHQTHRVHAFPAVRTDRLRVLVHATNGSRSASLYELRAYGPGSAAPGPSCTDRTR